LNFDNNSLYQQVINEKTKPLGALGMLEDIALKICNIQNTAQPQLVSPTIIVFAADHGIAAQGVSAYPAEVTPQMVLNFLQGGAAINVFCNHNNIKLHIVDAGVNYQFDNNTSLIDAKVDNGTANFMVQAAMSKEQLDLCWEQYKTKVHPHITSDNNIIGFGEMGIGNTTSAAALMSVLCKLPVHDCVGKGTGINNNQVQHKIDVIKQAIALHGTPQNAYEALQWYGGFEIAQMCAAILQACTDNKIILIDGFIATAAYLAAFHINKEVQHHALFCHCSNEQGHKLLLQQLNGTPILQLGMRLGEGTGCAMAYPIIANAVHFVNEMASFTSAGVSTAQ
jgi:nicotinate-nucleotide--dimethylbenzimidazole phosphoribosyltransferase